MRVLLLPRYQRLSVSHYREQEEEEEEVHCMSPYSGNYNAAQSLCPFGRELLSNPTRIWSDRKKDLIFVQTPTTLDDVFLAFNEKPGPPAQFTAETTLLHCCRWTTSFIFIAFRLCRLSCGALVVVVMVRQLGKYYTVHRKSCNFQHPIMCKSSRIMLSPQSTNQSTLINFASLRALVCLRRGGGAILIDLL